MLCWSYQANKYPSYYIYKRLRLKQIKATHSSIVKTKLKLANPLWKLVYNEPGLTKWSFEDRQLMKNIQVWKLCLTSPRWWTSIHNRNLFRVQWIHVFQENKQPHVPLKYPKLTLVANRLFKPDSLLIFLRFGQIKSPFSAGFLKNDVRTAGYLLSAHLFKWQGSFLYLRWIYNQTVTESCPPVNVGPHMLTTVQLAAILLS